MVREEIITGLNNALAKGESLERAKNSLAMAGYNSQEIEEASKMMNLGSVSMAPQKLVAANQEYKPLSTIESIKPKKKIPKMIIVLGVILLVLVIGLGLFMTFGEKILQAMFGS